MTNVQNMNTLMTPNTYSPKNVSRLHETYHRPNITFVETTAKYTYKYMVTIMQRIET